MSKLVDHMWNRLAAYNSERSRGIVHTPEWDEQMRGVQAEFDVWQRADAKARGYIIVGGTTDPDFCERLTEAARGLIDPYEATWADDLRDVDPRIQALLNAVRVVYDCQQNRTLQKQEEAK